MHLEDDVNTNLDYLFFFFGVFVKNKYEVIKKILIQIKCGCIFR